MTQGTNTPHGMTVQLKADLFRDIANLRGWNTNTAIGAAIGVDRRIVKRILDGEQPPTVEFIAGFLSAVPEAGFRRTFELVPATS